MTLPDAEARTTIATALDTNLVVEAAAGTGKTTAMVERIVNLMRSGHRRLAAVTFTHKAATELRQRLEQRIDNDEMIAALADCHIGTIHSFCARLLRERPVEAGLNPDFRELDDNEDRLLRAQAWNSFARELSQGRHRDLYALFETFGLDMDTLGQGFLAFADYPDIDEWTGRDAGTHQIDVDAFVKGVTTYTQRLAPLAEALQDADPGTDELMPICQILLLRFPRLTMPLALDDAHRLATLFKDAPKITQKQWAAIGLDKDAALEFAAAYRRFHDETAQPFRAQCLAAVYAAALEAYHLARDGYDALRRETGAVNFQDLLLTTARMLRDYPEVRADFAEQYERLLIDEVQDTDPVQAEIMFLLASSDPRERDWRRCAPRPGALFIVGDPKQSIYRFRRADITVYQEITRLIAKNGGEILGLASNFRSRPEVLDWINETFSPSFGQEETPHSPAYVPLMPGLTGDGEDENGSTGQNIFRGVFRLETISASKKDGITEKDIFRDEADRIARFIRHAVDTRLPLPDRKGAHPAQPGDFLIITYDKSKAGLYAAALRRLGLECRVSGGGTLGASEPLRLLADYLSALDNPDDPVALTAVLRGMLFGVSDAALYSWKKAGNDFSYMSHIESDNGNGSSGGIAGIFAGMRGHAHLLRRNAPASELSRIAEELGLWALSAMGDDPALQTGALATALELLKKEQHALPTLGSLVARLRQRMDEYDKDPLPAVETDGNAVRVMNLHKTKGLEAPVVFLACTRGQRRHEPSLAVNRTENSLSAALALRGGQHGTTLLAQPGEWPALAEEEALFLAAEKTRLNYVAATRAGAALVVSVHRSDKVWKTAFLPQYRHTETIPVLLPEPEGMVAAAAESADASPVDLSALDRALERCQEMRSALRVPSYAQERAKVEESGKAEAVAVVPSASVSFVAPVAPDQAAAYGEVLHRALIGGDIEELLRSFELSGALLPQVAAVVRRVRASAVWVRAQGSPQMYQEAPFTLYLEEEAKYVRGIIDLVFQDSGGWVIVDFKSGVSPAVSAAHRHQLRMYARGWEEISRERVVETGLYFLLADVYLPVETEEQSRLF